MAKSLLVLLSLLILHVELHHAYFFDDLDFSIKLRKNQTGHSVMKWSLTDGSPQAPQNMNVDVQTSISEDHGIQYLHLQAVIAVPPRRPDDYELFQGIGYYKFHSGGVLNFSEASSICTKEGGHLAIINSEAESSALVTLFARYPDVTHWAWLGFLDLDLQGNWVTIFGDTLESTGFSRWNPGKPDNARGKEHCGTMERNGGLDDLPCGFPTLDMPFICEWDLAWGET